ncbi:hypothetical protein Pcinc_007180 [Petrolisthes cinctipes]|uniref:Uncharacterized protein n=1 Tax=Petrolisthes cinctipes TaxID=88211 RepID=A0AAE1GBH2_PETCI|nr:hypothetical protein Pcinc_007180 [Petrolisthes cinctipes]
MADKQYQLRWNTHTSTFVNLLDQFRAQELYCDASLACCGRVYPVHQVVLSACSEFFSNVFTQASASQQQPLVVVQGAGRDEVECLLEFMYTGQVTISRVHLPALLRVASSLQVKGLLEAQGLQQKMKDHQLEAGVNDIQFIAKGMDTQFETGLQSRQFQAICQLNVGVSPGQLETEAEIGQREEAECDMVKDELTSWNTEGERTERLGEAASGFAKNTRPERHLSRMAPKPYDSNSYDVVQDIVPYESRRHETETSDTLSSIVPPHDGDTQPRLSPATSQRLPCTASNLKSPYSAQGVRSPCSSPIPLTTHRGPFHSLCETKEEPPDDWVKQEEEEEEEEERMEEESSWLQQSDDMKTLLGHVPPTSAPSSSPHTFSTPAITPSSPILTPNTSQLRRELLKPLPNLSPDLTCPTPFPLPSSSISHHTSPYSPPQPVSPHLHFSPSYHYSPLHTSSSPYPHSVSPRSSPSSPRSLPHPVITSAVERAYTKQIPPLMKIPSPGPPDVMPTQEPPIPQTTQFINDDSTYPYSMTKERSHPSIIHTRLFVPPPPFPPHPRPTSQPFTQTVVHSSESNNDAPLNLSRERRRGRDPLLGKIATKRKRRLRGPKCWEYLARLLNDPTTNPSLVKWENRSNGVFRLVQPAIVAQRWGRRAGKHANEALTYENFARGLRYHYATGALQPVSERSFVYRFGPKALKSLQENTPPALILDTDPLSSQQQETHSSSHSLPTVLTSMSSLPTVVSSTFYPPTTPSPASHSQFVT